MATTVVADLMIPRYLMSFTIIMYTSNFQIPPFDHLRSFLSTFVHRIYPYFHY